jgi:hypothetical protein
MLTTVTLDEALLDKARLLSGVQERSALLKEALSALIQRESARRLARLGGTEPQLTGVARCRECKQRSWSIHRSGSTICAAVIRGIPIWTKDKRLMAVADEKNLSYTARG